MKQLSIIIKPLGIILVVLSAFMLFTLGLSLFKTIPSFHLIKSFLITASLSLGIGLLFFFLPSHKKRISYFDGCFLVTFCWVIVALFSSILYYLAIPITFTDAFFESISGFTTTGATIFLNVEQLEPAILLWRSITQWLGGMGIVVLVVAIIPYLDFTNTSLNIYQAESPGPSSKKLTPTIQQTAKFLWIFYIILTIVLFIILCLLGMDWFNGINHSFTSIATGGFSTKNDSIAYFNSVAIESVIIVFIIISSINFSLHYTFLSTKSIKSYLDSELIFFINNNSNNYYCYYYIS